MTSLQIRGYAGMPIRCFDDWAKYATPPARNELHWEPDPSACELGESVQPRQACRAASTGSTA
jgi:hypothetical protein